MVTPENSPARGATAASTPAFDMTRATARQQVVIVVILEEEKLVLENICVWIQRISLGFPRVRDDRDQLRGCAAVYF